ncbi:MAG: hypothetical protein Q7T57_03390 [Dehalococcoidales bacterium]|nr:hypothetical protein [Dehalococcoidales bacterium]
MVTQWNQDKLFHWFLIFCPLPAKKGFALKVALDRKVSELTRKSHPKDTYFIGFAV